MGSNVTHESIQQRISALNRKLGRPVAYFTRPNGQPSTAAVGHIVANSNANGYQLAEVRREDGAENVCLLGLHGERLDSRCFYVLLGVLLACAQR
jgi:hypothetical protein